ncbi:MAG TPA: hypothetical protein VHY91_13955 [Pirellulales bacterium]|jgi:type IV secretory pathway TrbD component|nr:hypothetical protein [Pirellulales bacterium]
MSDILFQYHKVDPTTWVYLSSLLTIGLFFKFSRLLSVRNLDLIGLILLAPGLLLVEYGVAKELRGIEQAGYVWLFVVSGCFLVRLLLDPLMVRRPLLEPNLSVGGMTFIGTSLLVFLLANVINSKLTADDLAGARKAQQVSHLESPAPEDNSLTRHGPGYPLLHLLPVISTQMLFVDDTPRQTPQEREARRDVVLMATTRTMAILGHMAVVIGMVLIGFRHFDNIRTGIAAATLYLMLPYTAQMTGRVEHVLPAALLIWAVETYRRPLVAGALMGLAISCNYFPLFLLPLWFSFYWHRGLLRFGAGVLATLLLMVVSLIFTSDSAHMFFEQVRQMFGMKSAMLFFQNEPDGFWAFGLIAPYYRIPVFFAFLAMCLSLALWPAQKNLGTLMSCSAAVMLGTQFWQAQGGGLHMGWYLPLTLLTIFRPNLEDRVALSVLGEGWRIRRPPLAGAGVDRAA